MPVVSYHDTWVAPVVDAVPQARDHPRRRQADCGQHGMKAVGNTEPMDEDAKAVWGLVPSIVLWLVAGLSTALLVHGVASGNRPVAFRCPLKGLIPSAPRWQSDGVTGDAELARIGTAIHDEWFDVNSVVRDMERAELRLTIYPGRRGGSVFLTDRPPVDEQLPSAIGELVIREVADVVIKDDAGIGWFDVGGLSFDSATSLLRLWSNFPLEILIKVRKLSVKLLSP